LIIFSPFQWIYGWMDFGLESRTSQYN